VPEKRTRRIYFFFQKGGTEKFQHLKLLETDYDYQISQAYLKEPAAAIARSPKKVSISFTLSN